jgi:3-oxoacyl-[acyl-carrier-protein] synthase II
LSRRVVVTGVGLVTSLGIGTELTWQGLLSGVSGAGPITKFDATAFSTRFAAEVKGFEPTAFIEKKDVKKMDLFIQYAIAAAQFAVDDARLAVAPETAHRVGVFIASGIGGFTTIEREHRAFLEGGPRRISPFFIPSSIINLASGQVSIRFGAKGPNSATCTACTASAHAVGDAFELIKRDAADVMIAGGSEAAVCAMGVGGFAAMRALSSRNDDPARASRPFDKDRDGFVLGEGAGILILEELAHATARGATIYCELVGYGMSGDAYHMTGQPEDGDGAVRVMQAALAMSSTKSMTGHLLGAAGGLEAGISALALRHQILPPTINHDTPDPACDLDYVPNTARPAAVRYALSNSFGFGGTNGSLLFKRYDS